MENSPLGINTPKAVPKTTNESEPSSKMAVLILRKCPNMRKKMMTMLIIKPPMICGLASLACSYSPPHSAETPCGSLSVSICFCSLVVTFITFTPSTTSAMTVIVRLPLR